MFKIERVIELLFLLLDIRKFSIENYFESGITVVVAVLLDTEKKIHKSSFLHKYLYAENYISKEQNCRAHKFIKCDITTRLLTVDKSVRSHVHIYEIKVSEQ